MENLGARMQKSLKDLPQGGLSALTRLMSIVSVGAAVVVVLYAVLTIVLGTISLMAVPWSWTIGQKSDGAPVVSAQISTVQVTTSLPGASPAGGIAAANKAKQTPGNWFNAAIRPVFWSLPVFLLAVGLVEAARCLGGLAAGRYFTAGTVMHLRNFAIAGLFYVMLSPLMPALATAFCGLVTWIDTLIVRAWPPRHPYAVSMPTYFEASAAVGGVRMFSGFLIGLYAFTLAVIATVMARASAIVEDHAEII